MKKKVTIVITALALVLCFAIGGTLAWLQDSTQTVTNTFTYGDINITLTETDSDDVDNDANNNSYKMVPGGTISKDPKVTVEENSEACWLFVQIVEGGSVKIGDEEYTFDDFLTYAIKEGWTLLSDTTETGGSIVTDKTVDSTLVIYREVNENDAKNGKEYYVLGGHKTDCNGCVKVKDTVTKQMMNAIDGKDADGNEAPAELNARPTLTFTAYAVQSANLTDQDNDNDVDAADAWAIIESSSTGSN